MSKNNKKSKTDWNVEVLKAIAEKYSFSTRYIKQCITGDRTPIFADRIKSEYNNLIKEVEKVLTNKDL